MARFFTFVAFASLGLVICEALNLRQLRRYTLAEHPLYANKEITKKSKGLTEVVRTLFVIACTTKHERDVLGFTDHSASANKLNEEEYRDVMKQHQADNVEDFRETCKNLTGASWQKCEKACSANWTKEGNAIDVEKKQQCVGACNRRQEQWQKDCEVYSTSLANNVYKANRMSVEASKACIENHCADHMHIVMEAKDERGEARDEACKKQCSQANVKAACTRRTLVKSKLKEVELEGICAAEGNEKLESCREKKTTEIGTELSTCKLSSEANCSSDFEDCMGQGGDSAKLACQDRKNQCLKNESAGCSLQHTKALEDMSKSCSKEQENQVGSCLEEKKSEFASKSQQKCEASEGPACEKTCKDKCDVGSLNKCIDELGAAAGKENPTKTFCSELWTWMYDSEDRDPRTGDLVFD